MDQAKQCISANQRSVNGLGGLIGLRVNPHCIALPDSMASSINSGAGVATDSASVPQLANLLPRSSRSTDTLRPTDSFLTVHDVDADSRDLKCDNLQTSQADSSEAMGKPVVFLEYGDL
ncbi:unnamed protein product [Protopolystoma xenopodis]|uniref:Uncharacterized protein n=1 Tax=Protopolystoma xenopodis TaxID=117903 RepID=A0A448X4T4_9PLAT|nr:unnamed protein product [Protopolystoma xenopodis]